MGLAAAVDEEEEAMTLVHICRCSITTPSAALRPSGGSDRLAVVAISMWLQSIKICAR